MAPARGYKWNNKREESYLVLLRNAITKESVVGVYEEIQTGTPSLYQLIQPLAL